MPDESRGPALVTGATAGIGLEYARQLAARGHPLVLVARDRARLDATAESLRAAHGTDVAVLPCDLATPDGLDALVAHLTAHPVDVLVHNAGFGTKGAIARTDPAAQVAMVHLHVTCTNRLALAVLPGMVARGRGAYLVVASIASFVASRNNANYSATKGYQRQFMESVALELAGTGVYAQALCPGFTHTEFHARAAMKMERIPPWLWIPAAEVVRDSLAAMDRGGPTVVIPRWRWRAIAWLLRHAPLALLRRAATRYSKTR